MMKINLIKEYFLSFNSFILFTLTLEFVEFIVVLISLLCFGLMYYNHSLIAKLKYHFKQLPIFNRILAIWFSIFYAIPNKILVSNSMNKFLTAFFIFLELVFLCCLTLAIKIKYKNIFSFLLAVAASQ